MAANQVGEHPGGMESGGCSVIVDPWGDGPRADLADGEGFCAADLDFGAQDRHPGEDPRAEPPCARRLPRVRRTREGGDQLMAATTRTTAAERRRQILDAAVRVFARQGFHTCRVSDIADEAGVAYGLVYHYFRSKDEVLDTLFLERWEIMVAVIEQVDDQEIPARDKLYAIASFIVDSYRHDPELMKVIIVEVTRAANTFGRTHLDEIRRAYDRIAAIVERGMADGEFRDEVTPRFAAMAFYGAIEQVLTGWIFDMLPVGEGDHDRAKTFIVETICGGLDKRH